MSHYLFDTPSTCNLSHLIYSGQTPRLLKNRLNEHFTRDNSAVYQHHKETHADIDIFHVFSFDILHSNIINYTKRITLETFYINMHTSNLLNGCVSTQIA